MARSDRVFAQRYGPWAVIAGASEGLGLAFAEEAARRGLNIMLIARRAEVLNEAASSIAERFHVEVDSLVLDLSDPQAIAVVRQSLGDRDVGLVVYNAAVSLIGPFLDQPLDAHLKELDVNCRMPLAFAHAFGADMTRRGRGGIVLMSSMAGLQGSPLIANYAATKSYNLILGQGLWDEFRTHGVDVIACAAGAIRTPNYERTQPASGVVTPVQESGEVAEETLNALGKRPVVIPGRVNRIAALFMGRFLSRRRATLIMGANMRKLFGKPGAK